MKRLALALCLLLSLTLPVLQPSAGPLTLGGAPSVALNVLDYPTFQAALDALENQGGGTLEIPSGTYSPTTVPAFNGIVVPRNVSVHGQARSIPTLKLTDPAATFIKFKEYAGTSGGLTIENLFLEGPAVAGSGIGIDGFNSATSITQVVVRNTVIHNMPSWAVNLDTDNASNFVEQVLFEGVTCYASKTNGSLKLGRVAVSGANVCSFVRCEFNGPSQFVGSGNNKYGTDSLLVGCVHISHAGGGINFFGCSFQPSGFGEPGNSSPALSVADITYGISLFGCYFESPGTGTTHWINTDASSGCVAMNVSGCTFKRTVTSRGYQVLRAGNNGAIVGGTFSGCSFITSGTPAADDIELGTSGNSDVCLVNNYYSGTRIQVSNITAGTTWLEKGRVKLGSFNNAGEAAITNPQNGELIYNSQTNFLRVYAAGAWRNAP